MNSEFNINYGKNDLAGNYAEINGINMYYEVYGSGLPLFILHGNGSSISGMAFQIDYFKSRYKVITGDNRGHGKSSLGGSRLTYRQMADDWLTLSHFLGFNHINVLGWSDGGIIGIIMAMDQPDKITTLITMGANVKPINQTMSKREVLQLRTSISEAEQKIKIGVRPAFWKRKLVQLQMLETQPDIDMEALTKIKCPTLILAGEDDYVRAGHTKDIASNIHGAKCIIFPGESHFVPVSNPILFNRTVEEFLENTERL